jgi:hypothetical protein
MVHFLHDFISLPHGKPLVPALLLDPQADPEPELGSLQRGLIL